MKRMLITGFSGFVSRHFLNYLVENNLSYEVLGVDVNLPKFAMEDYAPTLAMSFEQVNLLDKEAVEDMIATFRPDYILHLASFSSVAYSWQHPADCFMNNTSIFLNVTEALRKHDLCDCRLLSVGSSEEYGDVKKEELPLQEDMPLVPVNPYAVARVSQEMMAKVLADSFGMQIMLTRSFNHMGPFQDERFVIPSFVRRILDIAESGAKSGEIETGDTSIVRDFVDVRDVVRAYYRLLLDGKAGEVYNICGEKGVSLAEVVDQIADIVGVSVTTRVNPDFVRPGDNQVVIGSAEKIRQDIGWTAEIPLRQTLMDMIGHMCA
ncbi:NAD-dependent epimerase/dehydratase family protein [Roseburia sp. AM51-8]|uniref:GDP-mannose 4,6-dehydratase n=1 Tax=Roseburia lenta TaxID=2763061 RepID=A0ABR7GFP4_9FIRM|nr:MULTISPECIES: GDP-mannose 4,6-dehydratase [Roseburia]MBC5686270.1 GDP-mannose 4,6-dehydratase [Roseburia lenta]RHQ01087.1 NAD-dependent epimerase/dehydratase family protein [Roseburia sp. AM51-8]